MKKGLFLITLLIVLSLSMVTSFAAELRVDLQAIDQTAGISTVVGTKEASPEFGLEGPAAVVGIWTAAPVHAEDWSIQFHTQPYTLGWVKLGTFDMSKCTTISMFIENDGGAVYKDKDGVGTKLQFSKTEKFEAADIIAEGIPPEKIGWGLGFDSIDDVDGLGKLVIDVAKTDYNGPVYIRFAYRDIIQYDADGTPLTTEVDGVVVPTVRNDGINIFKLAFNGDFAASTTATATAVPVATSGSTTKPVSTILKASPTATVATKDDSDEGNKMLIPIIIVAAVLIAGGAVTYIMIQKKKK